MRFTNARSSPVSKASVRVALARCPHTQALGTLRIPNKSLNRVESVDVPTSYVQVYLETAVSQGGRDAIRIVDLRIAGGFRGTERRWVRPIHGRLARLPQSSRRVRRLCRRRSAGSTGNGNDDKN